MKKICVLLLVALLLVGCSGNNDPYADFRGETSHHIFKLAEIQLADEDYGDAVKSLEALDALYPFGAFAKQGQLDIIYAYYENDQQDMATVAADRYIHLYPRDQHVDYAYYMRGLIGFGQGMTFLQRLTGQNPAARDATPLKNAYADFRIVAEDFPHSQYHNDALLRMAYIRNALAAQEVKVADYYFQRRAYVAALNRANDVVLHYQGAPAVLNALHVAADCYDKLGMTRMAQTYRLMLQKQQASVHK